MKKLNRSRSPKGPQQGVTLIEVLVSLVILMVSLLGLVGVMIQSQRSQVESYERVQALLLVQDMETRINANRSVASCYLVENVGTNNTTALPVCAALDTTQAQKDRVASDLQEWQALLRGGGEKSGNADVGAVLGARGCVSYDAVSKLYQVSIAWQGQSPTGAPPAGIACGKDLYGNDALRRAVSVTLQIS